MKKTLAEKQDVYGLISEGKSNFQEVPKVIKTVFEPAKNTKNVNVNPENLSENKSKPQKTIKTKTTTFMTDKNTDDVLKNSKNADKGFQEGPKVIKTVFEPAKNTKNKNVNPENLSEYKSKPQKTLKTKTTTSKIDKNTDNVLKNSKHEDKDEIYPHPVKTLTIQENDYGAAFYIDILKSWCSVELNSFELYCNGTELPLNKGWKNERVVEVDEKTDYINNVPKQSSESEPKTEDIPKSANKVSKINEKTNNNIEFPKKSFVTETKSQKVLKTANKTAEKTKSNAFSSKKGNNKRKNYRYKRFNFKNKNMRAYAGVFRRVKRREKRQN